MNCPACGHPSGESTAAYCAACGAPLASPPPLPPDPVSSGGSSDFSLGRLWPAVQTGFEMLQLDREAARRTVATPEAMPSAIIILAVVGLCWGIGTMGLFGIFVGPLLMLAGAFIEVAVIHLIATIVGGKGSYSSLLRCWGLLHVVGVVAIVPWIGGLLLGIASLWFLVALVPILEVSHGLPRDRSILVVAILFGLAVVMTMMLIALIVFGAISLAVLGGGT